VKPERNLGAAKPPSAKSETNFRPSLAQVAEPPYADPHVRWCGRGGAVRLPPIPIARATIALVKFQSEAVGIKREDSRAAAYLSIPFQRWTTAKVR
jgi:hypothetical protein